MSRKIDEYQVRVIMPIRELRELKGDGE